MPTVTFYGMYTGQLIVTLQGMYEGREALYKEHLIDFLPEYLRNSDIEKGHLKSFMSVMGTMLDDYELFIDKFVNIFDVDMCDVEMLPYLAQMLGITLDPASSTDVKRSIIKNAVSIYKRKGTFESFKFLCYSFGYYINLIDLWTQDYISFYDTHGTLWEDGGTWYKAPYYNVKLIHVVDTGRISFEEFQKIRASLLEISPINTVWKDTDYLQYLYDTVDLTEDVNQDFAIDVFDDTGFPFCWTRGRGSEIVFYRNSPDLLFNRRHTDPWIVQNHTRRAKKSNGISWKRDGANIAPAYYLRDGTADMNRRDADHYRIGHWIRTNPAFPSRNEKDCYRYDQLAIGLNQTYEEQYTTHAKRVAVNTVSYDTGQPTIKWDNHEGWDGTPFDRSGSVARNGNFVFSRGYGQVALDAMRCLIFFEDIFDSYNLHAEVQEDTAFGITMTEDFMRPFDACDGPVNTDLVPTFRGRTDVVFYRRGETVPSRSDYVHRGSETPGFARDGISGKTRSTAFARFRDGSATNCRQPYKWLRRNMYLEEYVNFINANFSDDSYSGDYKGTYDMPLMKWDNGLKWDASMCDGTLVIDIYHLANSFVWDFSNWDSGDVWDDSGTPTLIETIEV